MKNNELIPGREIYGTDPEPGWEQFDVYDSVDAEFVKFQVEYGRLVEGGPALNVEDLEELRASAPFCETSAETLKSLAQFKDYFRYLHAMNVRDEQGGDPPSPPPHP